MSTWVAGCIWVFMWRRAFPNTHSGVPGRSRSTRAHGNHASLDVVSPRRATGLAHVARGRVHRTCGSLYVSDCSAANKPPLTPFSGTAHALAEGQVEPEVGSAPAHSHLACLRA